MTNYIYTLRKNFEYHFRCFMLASLIEIRKFFANFWCTGDIKACPFEKEKVEINVGNTKMVFWSKNKNFYDNIPTPIIIIIFRKLAYL